MTTVFIEDSFNSAHHLPNVPEGHKWRTPQKDSGASALTPYRALWRVAYHRYYPVLVVSAPDSYGLVAARTIQNRPISIMVPVEDLVGIDDLL